MSNEVPPINKEETAAEAKIFELAPVATLIVKELAVELNVTFRPGSIVYADRPLLGPTLKKELGEMLLNLRDELTSNVIIPFEKTVFAFDLKKAVSARPFRVVASPVPTAILSWIV